MRLRIFGKTADDKGKQLEILASTLLESLGFKKLQLNVIAAGGDEIDLRGTFKLPSINGNAKLTLIGECKACSQPINIPDWLKFLGKVYSENLRNTGAVRGVMIALSGANGNVQGAYEELRRNTQDIDLVSGDDLANLLKKSYGLKSASQVTADIQMYTNDTIIELSLGYYRKRPFWILEFANSTFTLLDIKNHDTLEEPELITLVKNESRPSTFRNLKKEKSEVEALQFARKVILGLALVANGRGIKRPFKTKAILLNETIPKQSLTRAAQALKTEKLILNRGASLVLTEITNDIASRVEVLRQLTEHSFLINVVLAPEWRELVDSALVTEISKIQNNLPIDAAESEMCIQLLRWSPSALAWAIRPDPMITGHRNANEKASSQIDVNDQRYFKLQLLTRAILDFKNQQLSKLYFETLGLRELEFTREVRFKSETGVELDCRITERNSVARAVAELGGGLLHVWLVEDAPEPWAVRGQK